MIRKALGLFLFFTGLFLISEGLLHLAKRQGLMVSSTVIPDLIGNPSPFTEEPIAIDLPESKINLPVIGTEIVNKSWPTSEKGVSYIKSSGKLGVSGNHVMYGHNWKNLLGRLHNSKVGDKLSITSNQNKQYLFQIKYIAVVDAGDVSILADTVAERLTLYTCTGLLDSQRLVIVAERIKG